MPRATILTAFSGEVFLSYDSPGGGRKHRRFSCNVHGGSVIEHLDNGSTKAVDCFLGHDGEALRSPSRKALADTIRGAYRRLRAEWKRVEDGDKLTGKRRLWIVPRVTA
jgi:hypothetical protein